MDPDNKISVAMLSRRAPSSVLDENQRNSSSRRKEFLAELNGSALAYYKTRLVAVKQGSEMRCDS